MPNAWREIAFTPAVRAAQAEINGRDLSPGPEGAVENAGLTEAEALFLARRDSFYMATVSETGWPYVQHRGGPPGFVRVIRPDLIGWVEFSGNRQYVTTGNLAGDDRVSLFFMDYPNRRRLKLFGHARIVGRDDPGLADLVPAAAGARVERGLLVRVVGFDWNCPQHIAERFGLAEVEAATRKMLARIAELEADLARRDAAPEPDDPR